MVSTNHSPSWGDISEAGTTADEIALARRLIANKAVELDTTEDELIKAIAITYDLQDRPKEDTYGYVIDKAKNGQQLTYNVTAAGTVKAELTPISKKAVPVITLIETYQLTSFLGDYGAAKTIKTFSLLPNEKTTISVKTWKNTTQTTTQASSVLDSWTVDSSDSLERSFQQETTSKTELTKVTNFEAETSGKGHFNVGIWGVEGSHHIGYKENWNDSRENFAKGVSNATQKHVASVSSKRNIEVNTNFESKAEAGEEQTIVRELENVNAGRVLNFVFRQLNQEYITYLHLVDLKLAFDNGMGQVVNKQENPYYYKEFPLSEIEDLLQLCIRDRKPTDLAVPKDEVRQMIVQELTTVADYKGKLHEFVECVDYSTGKAEDPQGAPLKVSDYLDAAKRVDSTTGRQKLYLRVKRTEFHKDDQDVKHEIDGIILAKNNYILPTDSIIVEALLGQAEGLDRYSIDSRMAVIDMKRAEIDKMNLANKIIDSKDKEKAEIYAKVYPPLKEEVKEATP